MKAQLQLSQAEVAQATKEYIQRQGWRVETIKIEVRRGYDGDSREAGTPDEAVAVAEVSPQPIHVPSAFDDRR